MGARDEQREKLLAVGRGELTLAELQGLTAEHARLLCQLGCELAAAGRNEEARVLFQGLVASNPRDAGALAALGTVLQKLGRTAEALASYDRALARSAGNAVALAGRGELRLRAGDPRGLADLRQAVRVDPDACTHAARRARELLSALATPAQEAVSQL